MPYKVYAALKDDINSGWVWVGGFDGTQRSIIKIKNEENGKSVYCEFLKIDENFKKQYVKGNTIQIENEQNAIIVNEWYRTKLDVNKNTDVSLSISTENHLIAKFMACIEHPQIVVRLATWLGVVSIALGIIGIIK
jgi:hypothetical protein